MNFIKAAVLALAGVAVCAPAWANDAHRLAYSKKLGVEVLAKMAEGNWCKPELDLMVIAEEEGFFSGGKFKTLMNKLGLVLAQECPTARTANIEGISDSTGQTAFQGTATSDSKWQPIYAQIATKASATKALDNKHFWEIAEKGAHENILKTYVSERRHLLNDDLFIRSLALFFEPRRYQETKDNEFKIGPYLSEFKERMNRWSSNPPEYVRVSKQLVLGKYDFEKKGFPVDVGERLVVGADFPIGMGLGRYDLSKRFPHGFIIEDFDRTSFIPLEPELAERLISEKNGSDDRRVVGEFLFRLKHADEPRDHGSSFSFLGRTSKIDAEFVDIRFYEDSNMTKLVGQNQNEPPKVLDRKTIEQNQPSPPAVIIESSGDDKTKVVLAKRSKQNGDEKGMPFNLILIGAVAVAGMGGGLLWFRRRKQDDGSTDSQESQPVNEEPADPSLEDNPSAAASVVGHLVETMLAPGDTKVCPACLSEIPRQATACKYCGKQELEDPAVALAAKSEALTDALTEKLRFYREIPVYVLSEGGWLVGQMRFENEADVFKHIDLYSDQFIKPSSFRLPSVDLILEYDKSLSEFEIKLQKPAQEVAAARLSSGISPQISSGGQTFAHVGNSPSVLPGVIGCIFAILSLFFLAIIFIPLGLLTSTIALIIGIRGKSGANMGLGVVGIIISSAAVLNSPTFWAIFGLAGLF